MGKIERYIELTNKVNTTKWHILKDVQVKPEETKEEPTSMLLQAK